MSTEKTFKIVSSAPKETEALGTLLGASLRGGEIVELVSDLGGGKNDLCPRASKRNR